MRNLKLLKWLLIIPLIIFSCTKDNNDEEKESELENITIPIDDEQSFNMTNFVLSFQQLFMSDAMWQVGFTHVVENKKATASIQNLKIFGQFGEGVFTITHLFDGEGIITSSERNKSYIFDTDSYPEKLIFTYKYDLDGMIVQLTKTYGGSVIDIVDIEYNSNKLITKKTHPAGSRYSKEDVDKIETFEYDSSGRIIAYKEYYGTELDDHYEYQYDGDNMVKATEYYNGSVDDVYIYMYNSSNLLVKQYEEDDPEDYTEFEYTADKMIITDYYDGLIDDVQEYGMYLQQIKSWSYYYNSGEFEYCRTKIFDDENYVTSKEYFEGSVESLELVGYSVIDNRDAQQDNKKTKELIYDASETLLYYATFDITDGGGYFYISGTNWFLADDTPIDSGDITEDWVTVLVR